MFSGMLEKLAYIPVGLVNITSNTVKIADNFVSGMDELVVLSLDTSIVELKLDNTRTHRKADAELMSDTDARLAEADDVLDSIL